MGCCVGVCFSDGVVCVVCVFVLVGNAETADEVLEMGVRNGALTVAQKEELWQRVVAGRAGWVAAFSGSPQEQRVLALRTKMQALRRTQESCVTDKVPSDGKAVVVTPRGGSATTALDPLNYSTPVGYSTGRDSSTFTPLYTVTQAQQGTPVSQGRYGTGFSTVSKAPRTGNLSPLLTTPSLPTRSGLKSQSTSRKPTARFMLGAVVSWLIVDVSLLRCAHTCILKEDRHFE